jgi:hypothetical protein
MLTHDQSARRRAEAEAAIAEKRASGKLRVISPADLSDDMRRQLVDTANRLVRRAAIAKRERDREAASLADALRRASRGS